MLNRTDAPKLYEIQGVSLESPEEIIFENGLKVFVFRATGQALLKAEFIFQNAFAGTENPLLNTCFCQMLKEGTQTRNSAQIADEVDFYGAYLLPEYSFDHSSLTLYTLNKHLSSLLPVIHDIFNHAVFPEEELATYIRNNKQTLQISLQKNDYLARRLFYKELFGDSRYGATPSEEAYDNLRRDDLITLYKKQIHPKNCTLVLSGDITEEVLDLIRSYFDNKWSGFTDPKPISAPEFPVFKPELIVEERPDALQSAIRLGMPFVNRTHPDFPAIQFVNTLLGGYFGSRLMRNIREEKGYTYSIGSAIASLKYAGFFTIASEVGVDTTAATLTEIEKEFEQLRNVLSPMDEVALVRNYMLGSVLGSVESIFSHADKFKAVYFYGLTLDYYRRYDETIRSMTPEKVLQIAQQYFDYNKLSKIVVGKMDMHHSF